MTKFHILRGDKGEIGICGASEGHCAFGEDGIHYDNSVDAKKAAVEKMRWERDNTLQIKYPGRGRFGLSEKPDDPPVIGNTYKPLTKAYQEAQKQQERYVADNENPNMRDLEDFDRRYLGAQERSIRLSSLDEEDTKIALKNYVNAVTGLIEYDVQDKEGSTVRYRFNKEGKFHSLHFPAYEDHTRKERYYKGIVHAEEEIDGPAVVMKNDNGEAYIKYGLTHRQHGPAVFTPLDVQFWRHGLKHRAFKAAVLRADGAKEFWEKGIHLRTEVPDTPVPPESFIEETEDLWDDPVAVEQAEYEKDNYI